MRRLTRWTPTTRTSPGRAARGATRSLGALPDLGGGIVTKVRDGAPVRVTTLEQQREELMVEDRHLDRLRAPGFRLSASGCPVTCHLSPKGVFYATSGG